MTTSSRQYWTRTFPAWAYCVAVFIACTVPVGVPHTGGLWTDKSDHLLAFLVLQILVLRALATVQSPRKSLLGQQLSSIAVCAVYGAVLEVWQGLLPWRSMELLDWVADVVGALLGAALYGSVRRSCKPGSAA